MRARKTASAGRSAQGATGQASVELLAGLPVLVLSALVALQLLVTGYALTLADGAAESGAVALASQMPATAAVRRALPGWAEERVSVHIAGGRVSVAVRPPSPLPAIAELLTVESSAWVRRPGAG